jgi:hypothetical protein
LCPLALAVPISLKTRMTKKKKGRFPTGKRPFR